MSACLHGDDACPCQDGDICNYVDGKDGTKAMRCPTTGIVGCQQCVRASTFWNGEPADALRCKVLVPRHSWPLWLDADASPLRHAVRVQQGGYKFFLDNEDGSGWAKVTNGRGSPHYGHRSLPDGCAVSSGDSDWEPPRDTQ